MRVWTSAGKKKKKKNFIYISKTVWLRSNHALPSPPPPPDITTQLREVWVENNGRCSLMYPHFWLIEQIPRSIPHVSYILITNKPTKLDDLFSAGFGLKWSNPSQNILEGVCCKLAWLHDVYRSNQLLWVQAYSSLSSRTNTGTFWNNFQSLCLFFSCQTFVFLLVLQFNVWSWCMCRVWH